MTTTSQIKSYVAAAVVMLAGLDAATLNLLGELLTPTWAKGLRVAVILAGVYVTGNNQSWSRKHTSLPVEEAKALAQTVPPRPEVPLAHKAVMRIRESVKGSK